MDCHIRFVWFHRCLICDLRMGFYIRESGFSALESDMLHHHVAPPCFWRAFPTSCVFITATVSWLQFETSLLMPHRHITKHPPLFPLSPSQRLVPDSDVRLLCMDPAGGRGIVRSGPHTALDRTRPSKIKPTLLSASHNPQGGDDLDCPVKSMWSLLFLPKPCVCVFVCVRSRGGGRGGSGRWHCTGIAWSAKGSNEWAKDTPPPRRVLSQCSERSSCLVGTVATAMDLLSSGSKLIRFRSRADATSRHDAEQLGRQQADLFRVC